MVLLNMSVLVEVALQPILAQVERSLQVGIPIRMLGTIRKVQIQPIHMLLIQL